LRRPTGVWHGGCRPALWDVLREGLKRGPSGGQHVTVARSAGRREEVADHLEI